jgi:iron uptake system EfeUOB component EfeO/EfeM
LPYALSMEAARATWTDSRLDDLNDRVKEVSERVTNLDTKVDAGFGRLDDRIDKLNHTMIAGLVALISIITVLLTAFLTIVVTHL